MNNNAYINLKINYLKLNNSEDIKIFDDNEFKNKL